MSHADLLFWLSLALVLAGVAVLPMRARQAWLILASLGIYGAPDPMRLVWLAGACAVTLMAAHPAEPGAAHRRGLGIAALVLCLVWARFFELAGLPDPEAPPGLSFIIFTAIAAIIEKGRREGAAWRWRDLVLHLVWFAKLPAGPIERPGTLIPQFAEIGLRPGLAALGLAYLVTGLIKKVVIADSLAPIVAAGFDQPAFAAPVDLILAVYAFAFQIYCDFSGYSDMAVGLSALVGLRLSRNFDRPYLAVTVTEFWARRWHVTLGNWFRDFVFIPLGGSRRGRMRRVVNLMIVFLLSGVWHAGLGQGIGWGFVLWGALNGALVAGETFLAVPARALPRLLRGVVTLHLILLGWVFFRAESLEAAAILLRRIWGSLGDLPDLILSYPFTAVHLSCGLMVGLLFIAEAASGPRGMADRLAALPLPLRWAGLHGGFVLLLLAGRWQDAEFIYAGF